MLLTQIYGESLNQDVVIHTRYDLNRIVKSSKIYYMNGINA